MSIPRACTLLDSGGMLLQWPERLTNITDLSVDLRIGATTVRWQRDFPPGLLVKAPKGACTGYPGTKPPPNGGGGSRGEKGGNWAVAQAYLLFHANLHTISLCLKG